jgi:hypothetical protein
MRRLPITLVLALTCGCAGADGLTPVDTATSASRTLLPVQTDSLSYGLARGAHEYRAFALATYRNTSSAPVYYRRCGGRDTLPMFDVGRSGPDSLRRLFVDFAWACVGGVPTGVIPPGRSITVRVPLGSVDQPNMQPAMQPQDLVGELRVELELCADGMADSDRCTLLPAVARRSNPFIVHY